MNTLFKPDSWDNTQQAELPSNASTVDQKKKRQRRSILHQLYRTGPRTISQIARSLQVSIPSITGLIEELIDENWIVEIGTGEAQYGRKPVLYGLITDRRYLLVLDITVHDTQIIVFNLNHEVVVQQATNLRLQDDASFIQTLNDCINSVLENSAILHSDLTAVGVSMPGLVDPRTGTNYTYKRLDPKEQSLGDNLKALFALPVYLINDTKATIMGEHGFGLAKGKNHVLSVNFDWGIGLGMILNGEVYQGASGFAGELGHIQVRPDGELCHCGKVGCLDTVTSASSLIRRIKRGIQDGRISRLADLDTDQVGIEQVIEMANLGDAFAIDVLHDIGNELGKGLAIAVHLFNPETIIVDGILAKAGKFISNPIEQAINKYCLADFKNNLTIAISELGEQAKLYGVHMYVMQNVLLNS